MSQEEIEGDEKEEIRQLVLRFVMYVTFKFCKVISKLLGDSNRE